VAPPSCSVPFLGIGWLFFVSLYAPKTWAGNETPCGYPSMPKKLGQEIGNTLRVSLYAQKTWAGNRKHPAGIPLCPKNLGRK